MPISHINNGDSGLTARNNINLAIDVANNPNLGSLSALTYASTSFVKMTGAATFGLDTNTYITSLAGALLATGATTGATSQAQAFTSGVITGKIYPSADSTTAVQINKANGTTNVLNVDTTNGNVGIGTTNPGTNLEVANSSASSNIFNTSYVGSTDGSFLELRKARGSLSSPSNSNIGDTIGTIGFYPLDGGTFQKGASIYSKQVDTGGGYSNMVFNLHQTTGAYVDQLTLNYTGSSVFKGSLTADSVGAATNDSNTTMNSNTANLYVQNSSGTVNNFAGIKFFSEVGQNDNGLIGFIGAQHNDDTGLTAGDLVFGTKANSSVASLSEYMRIKQGGNIGIGTISPAEKLDVAGNMQVSSAVALSLGGYVRKYSEAVSAALSGATGVIAVNIPIGARLLGVQLRVDTLITSGDGSTAWSAAYTGGAAQAIASGQAFTKNTKVNTMFDSFAATPLVVGSVATITISATAGTFSAGVVRAICYYEDFTAMGNQI